ncbi:hypothetical protein HPB49_004722 [Dermacentor silvarum]|uniref:Uncharacterized protein n=1 Tax=Dermacentor silvarum TaxID=543639 RepID=A0ACB8DV34_DERSI|nr:hypothetical protein HPB49_004722 [Dermacentor silvarum]
MGSHRNVWPVKPGEPDKEFRGVIFTWISTLQEDPIAAPFLQGFNAGLLLRPGTPQYLRFLTGLSTFVLQDRLKDQIELAVDFSHEALPKNVIKFTIQENKSRFVTLHKQLNEIEADYAEQERHFRELLSNFNLTLNTLRVEAESRISDESFERLTKVHKGLLEQKEMISTRMEQIEEHCSQLLLKD